MKRQLKLLQTRTGHRQLEHRASKAVLADAEHRVMTAARVHDHLWQGDQTREVDLGTFLEDLCQGLDGSVGAIKIRCTTEKAIVNADFANPETMEEFMRWLTRLFRSFRPPMPPVGTRHSRSSAPFKHLSSGVRYRVTETFIDHDRVEHPVGEEWTFIGHSFLPYDDGLSLFVSPRPDAVTHIRLQWQPEEQGQVIENLETYVVAEPA